MRINKTGLSTDPLLDKLIVQLLSDRQQKKCVCGVSLSIGFQLTHQRYGDDITLKDLSLRCGECHAKEHGLKRCGGTFRL